ncbi:hypothetical protein PTSG_03803 [Salpingoeca rosetta]|uniref:SH3 domain-containing protein n=1 Tax=Salpingoeca rosetta (strain ATCC 50818 / BSB-021) TaxID=946362 RepID=F2U5F6_SALR5|nr:uncharacterized protein PTSG_03803 [Salpingoeca rosetta]EGD83172.1 hypothetical protein PTSG_03803 [Salpingoeca rosetta]|eukprot:XP_004995536.1 hypothetical protein PTSG_03803 [Salpingoeca rosetta]
MSLEDTSSVSGSGEEDMNGAGRDTMNSRHTALDDAVVDDVDVDAHGGDGGDAFGRGPRLDRRGDSPSRRTPSDKLFGIDSEDIMPHGHPKKKLPAGARPVFPFEHDDDPSAGFQRSKLPDHYQDRPEHYTTTDDEDRDRGDEGDDGGVLDAEARRVERRRRERRRSSSREASALDQRGLEAQLSQPSPRGRRAGKKGRRGRNRMRSRSGGGSALDDDDDDDDDGAVVAGAGDVRLSGEETTSSASSSSSSSDEDEEEDAVARKRSFFFRGRKKTKKQKEKEKEKERKRKEKEERRSASRMSKATTKASKRSGADDDDDDDDDDDADEHARGNRVRAAAGYERYALPEDSPAPRRKSRFRSLSPRFGRRKVSPHSRAGDDDGDHHHRRPRNERNEDRDRRREQRGPEHLWEDERMLPRGGGGGRARARAPGGGGRRLRGVYDDGRDDGYDPVMDAARYPPPPLDRRGGGGRAGPVPGRRERLPPRDRDPYRRPASLSPSRFHHRAMMPYDDDDDLLPPPPSARHHPMPRDDALMMRRVAAEEDELMRRRRAAAGGGGGGERMRHRDVHRPRHAAPPPGEPLPPPTRRPAATRAGHGGVRFGGPGGPGGGAYLHDDRRPMPGPPRDAWAGRSAEGLRAGEYRVLYAYRPTDPNQLELAVGDVVRVKGDPQENWQYGFNTRNQRSGWFPRTYLDFTNDQEAADRLRRNREMPMSPGHQSQLPHVPAPDY